MLQFVTSAYIYFKVIVYVYIIVISAL